jgi:hypothetical protein
VKDSDKWGVENLGVYFVLPLNYVAERCPVGLVMLAEVFCCISVKFYYT